MTLVTTPETSGPRAVGSTPVRRPRPPRRRVVAVVVSHDGGTWLPRTLDAVASQTRLPDLVVGVDTGSQDGSADLLRASLGADAVVGAGSRTGFGDAVRLGLAHAATRAAGGPGDGEAEDWVWLLHDDAAPQPAALQHLLGAAAASAQVGVVGPKLVAWDDASRLLEAGLTVARDGRRHTGIAPGERDQGQHDHRTDVLAVGTAGMLVARDLWDRLGGLDPALPLLRDDIDLCWRAHLAGRRVVLASKAVVADAQASSSGLRTMHATSATPARLDRRHGLHVALARCSWLALPVVLVTLVVSGLARSAGLLVLKAPRRAADELAATTVVALTPWRWLGSRWRSRRTRSVRRRDVAGLFSPRFPVLRHALERFGGLAAYDPAAAPPVHSLDDGSRRQRAAARRAARRYGSPDADGLVAAARAGSLPRRVLRHPLTACCLLLAAATAVASRGLGHGVLTGGQLRPAGGDAPALWHAAVDGWTGPGLGAASTASPAAALRAIGTLLLAPVAGDLAAARAVELLVVGAPVLAAVSAYLAAGILTPARWTRGWAALAWGASIVLTGAVSEGRLGPLTAGVLLPLSAALLVRALARSGRWTSACAAALALAATSAVLPVTLAAAALVLAGALLAGRAAVRVRALVVLVLTPALLGPWLRVLVDDPRQLLAGPGAVTSTAGADLLRSLAGIAPLPAGLPWWTPAAVVAPLLLAGLAGLLRGGRPGAVLAGWGIGLLGLAAALAAPLVTLAHTPDGPVRPWAGSGVLLLLLVAIGSATAGSDGLRARLDGHRFAWRQLLLAPVAALAVLAPLVAAAGWAWTGSSLRSGPASLPAVAADAAASPQALRTLTLGADGDALTYRLDGAEPGAWSRGLTARGAGPTTAHPVADAVRDLTGSAPSVDGLLDLAVGYLVVDPPAAGRTQSRLDTVAGLTRLGTTRGASLWRVLEPAGRVRLRPAEANGRSDDVPVVGAHARVDTRLAAATPAGTLLLSEPAAAGWRATLDGEPLRQVDGAGWQQAFAVPAGGGHLEVSYVDTERRWWLLGQGVLAVVVLLLAVPGRTQQTPRQASGPATGGPDAPADDRSAQPVSS